MLLLLLDGDDVGTKRNGKMKTKKKDKSPGGESNARSPDYKLLCVFKLQSGALNQLGYREEACVWSDFPVNSVCRGYPA